MPDDSEPPRDAPSGTSAGKGDHTHRRKDDGDAEKAPDSRDAKSKNGDDPDGKKPPEADAKPLYKRPLIVLLVLALLLAAILAAIVFWRSAQHHASTDDAFIDGTVSAIAAQTAGRVLHLYVTDNQVVAAGDPLIDIDDRDSAASVAQAEAQVQSAESQLRQARAQVALQRASVSQAAATTQQSVAQHVQAEQDLARYAVVDPDAVSRQQQDNATATARAARARVDAGRASERAALAQVRVAQAQIDAATAAIATARANLAAAELQRSYAHLVAPVSGRVARRAVETGNVVAAGQRLMTIVDPVMWVTANYKETQLDKLRRGLAVDIKVDAYPSVTFHGRVDSLQAGTGSYFSLLPAENATGNYVKVVQRVPVKIVFDDDRIRDYAIGPGMSVTPDVQLP